MTNIMGVLLISTGAFGLLALAIVMHELGHVTYFRNAINKKVKIRFFYKNLMQFGFRVGHIDDYKLLTKHQYAMVNLFGIIMGSAPIIAFGLAGLHVYLLLIFPYLWGCRQDIKEFANNMEWEDG